MKKVLQFLCCLFVLNIGNKLQCASADTLNYRVANWYNFKQAAVSFTFDDNWITQFSIGKPILDEYQFPGTFFVITSLIDNHYSGLSWDYLSNVVKDGHEIASHTITHDPLDKISLERCNNELQNSQKRIEEKISSYKCETLAYPGTRTNDSIIALTQKYYIAARIGGGVESTNPKDFFRLKSAVLDSKSDLRLMNDYVNMALNQNGWCCEQIHALDSAGYEPINSKVWKDHIKYIKSIESKLWVGTFKDIAKYIKERENLRVSYEYVSDTASSLIFYTSLDKNIYNHPLTFSFNLSTDYDSISIKVNNNDIPYSLTKENGRVITFNLIPDSSKIVFRKSRLNSIKKNYITDKTIKLSQNYPNPFNSVTKIEYEVSRESNVELKVFDLLGNVVYKLSNKVKRPGTYSFSVDGNHLSSNIYYYNLVVREPNSGETIASILKKMILLK